MKSVRAPPADATHRRHSNLARVIAFSARASQAGFAGRRKKIQPASVVVSTSLLRAKHKILGCELPRWMMGAAFYHRHVGLM